MTRHSNASAHALRRLQTAPAGWRNVLEKVRALLRARSRRRLIARLAELPDERLEDVGLFHHPEIVRWRDSRPSRFDESDHHC